MKSNRKSQGYRAIPSLKWNKSIENPWQINSGKIWIIKQNKFN